ncbi:AAA family ATPase [Terrabacter sp. Ter38]|uniref:AAA family ATPase n=1 Tax=Terrabacter sp. Ter38 TaxID=2926030 RepID=UPI0021174526|nr:AAA family ATPase [Terrabacter sp. Ter38]
MEHSSYWSLIKRYIVLIVACSLLGGAIGAFMQLKDASGYLASARVFANSKRADNVAVSQSTSLAVQRMESYIRLANSTRLADRVIARLGGNSSAAAMADRISATLDKDTVIMTLNVQGSTPDEARRVIEVLPSEFTALVNQLVDLPVTNDNATTFTIVDGPFVRKNSSLTKLVVSTVFGLILGAAIGLAIASIRLRRMATRTPQGVTGMTGMPVVGIIPGGDRGRRKNDSMLPEGRRLAYHRLARNLSHLATTRHRLVVACSPAGEPSATPTVIGLARALAQRGDAVLVVDASFSGHGTAEAFEVASNGNGLEAVKGVLGLDEAVTKTPFPNLRLLQLGHSHEELLEIGAGHKLAELLDYARTQYDTVLVDASPVLSQADIPTAVEIADCVILVIDQFETPAAETRAAINGLSAMTTAAIGIVIDRAVSASMSRVQMEIGLVLTTPEESEEALSLG